MCILTAPPATSQLSNLTSFDETHTNMLSPNGLWDVGFGPELDTPQQHKTLPPFTTTTGDLLLPVLTYNLNNYVMAIKSSKNKKKIINPLLTYYFLLFGPLPCAFQQQTTHTRCTQTTIDKLHTPFPSSHTLQRSLDFAPSNIKHEFATPFSSMSLHHLDVEFSLTPTSHTLNYD